MIVNRDHPHNHFLLRLESLLPPDKNFYRFDFNKIDFKPVIEKARSLTDKNLNILLDCTMEGFQSYIPDIYQNLVINLDIKEENIFLISGAADIQLLVEKYAKQFNKKPFFSVWFREFEHMIATQLYYERAINGKSNPKFDIIGDRRNLEGFQKSFLCLNRRWRLHRPVLVGMLAKRNLLHRGFVSLTESDQRHGFTTALYDSILSTHADDNEIFEYFRDNYDYLNSLTPLTLDLKSLKMSKFFGLVNELEYFYANSYFNVVTETNFYVNAEKYNSSYATICEGTRFLTEKTFKPIVYKHPFILASVPNMLELLRDIGYKTFHPYIDESYDKEIDDGKRMIKIVDEIERLSYLNETDLKNFIKDTYPICEHNYNLLLQRRTTLFKV